MTDPKLIFYENDTFRYQLVTANYLDETLATADSSIFADGAASKLLGCPSDPEAMKELRLFATSLIEDGVSVIAVHKKNDKVAGIALNKIFVKNQPYYEVYANSFKNIKARRMITLRNNTLNTVNLFDVIKAECLMELVLLGVLPEYRKNGIAKKLTEVTLEIAQKLRDGVNVKHSVKNEDLPLEPTAEAVVGLFSSFVSQKIGKDLKFTVAAEKSNEKWELLGTVIVNENLITKCTMIDYFKLK